MTQFALAYIAWRVWHRLLDFFYHWYVRSAKIYGYAIIGFLEKLDRFFAFRITLKYFGQPLFQDRSPVGYIMGFAFRSTRLLFGGIFYFFAIIFAILIYLAWCAAPALLFYKILTGT